MLAVLIAGNVVFHAEVIRDGGAEYGIRIGIAALIGLIMLVGGRIVPSFTRNWLARNNPGRLPQPSPASTEQRSAQARSRSSAGLRFHNQSSPASC